MDQAARGSALGPVVFAGLTIYTVMASAFLPEVFNPADRMDMAAAAQAADLSGPTGAGVLPALPGRDDPMTRVFPGAARPPVEEIALAVMPPPARPQTALGTALLPLPEIAGVLPPLMRPVFSPVPALQKPLVPAVSASHSSLPTTPEAAAVKPVLSGLSVALGLPQAEDKAGVILPAWEGGASAHNLPRLPAPGPRPEDFVPPAPGWVEVTGDFVHLRDRPGGPGVLSVHPRGTRGVMLETRGLWVRLRLAGADGATGWMYGDYLRRVYSD